MRHAKTRWLLAFAALAALALAGCGGGAVAPADGQDGAPVEPPPPGAPALTLGFTDAPPVGDYVAVDAFELAGTASIRVVADWANVAPDQVQRLELRRPNGVVFHATTIPFTGAAGSDRSVTVLTDGRLRVVYVLEVAGTVIESYAMTGTWQATATLEDALSPPSATATFELY